MEATTPSTTTEIRPFSSMSARRSWTSSAAGSSPRAGPPRSWSTTARRACSSRRSRHSPATGPTSTTGASARQAERAAPVHDRDRRGRDPFHPCSLRARGCAAAGDDARLARLGHRAARVDRAAHRSDRARRSGRGRVPSRRCRRCPGYGFSAEPTEIGWDVGRIAKAWAELMRRLGYDRYVAQGGDVGAAVTDAMGRQAPDGLVGIHVNLLRGVLAGRRHAGGDREGAGCAEGGRDIQERPASATSWSRPRGRRRSATRRWIHRSPWRPGCSTTTPTATTRSPAPFSTESPRATSPGSTSSTTSRRTG